MYNVLDKLKEIAAKDQHYANAADSAGRMGTPAAEKLISEGVHGETCNECGMYESHCECPSDKEVLEADSGISQEAEREVRELVKKFKNIEGDYEPTLLQGVAHYLTDSGIYSDAFSAKDREWLDANLSHLLDDDGYETDEWNEAAINSDELEANDVLNILYDISERTGANVEKLADLAVELEERGEDKMGEGNEFSGELAKARAAGAKEFEVDGKKYAVKEDKYLGNILRHAGITMITQSGTMAKQADGLVESINKTKAILNENFSGGLNLTPVAEKWAGDAKIKQTGQYADKTIEELQKMRSKLKASGPHDEDSKEAKKLRQINFAIRSKKDWKGGVTEDGFAMGDGDDEMGRKGTGVTLGEEQEMKVGDTKRTHKGGTLTKTEKGLRHTAKDYDDEDEDAEAAGEKRGRGRPKKADKDKESAKLPWGGKPPKASKYKLPKHKGRTWGMKGDTKFDRTVREGLELAASLLGNKTYPQWKQETRRKHAGVEFRGNAEKCVAIVENKIVGKYIAEAVKNPYAIGMAQAMKSTGDTPPLEKKTITKAHDIAKAIKKDVKEDDLEEVSKGEYIKKQDAAAEKAGKDSFTAFGQKFSTKEIDETISMLERMKALAGLPADMHADKEAVKEADMQDVEDDSLEVDMQGDDGKVAIVGDNAYKMEDDTLMMCACEDGEPTGEYEAVDMDKLDATARAEAEEAVEELEAGDSEEEQDSTDAEDEEEDEVLETKDKEDKSEKKDGLYGKGVYESLDSKFDALMKESININMSQSTEGPTSLTVTASDDDAMALANILKAAGLGAKAEQVYQQVQVQPQDASCGELEEDNSGNALNPTYGTMKQTVDPAGDAMDGQTNTYKKRSMADNPMQTVTMEQLYKQFEAMK